MITSITGINEASWDTPIVLRGSYERMIADAANIGYDAIELHIRDPFLLDVKKIKRYLNFSRIQWSAIGTGPSYSKDKVYLTHKELEIRRLARNRILRYIEIASEFGATVIIGLIKGQIKDSGNQEKYEDYLVEGLNVCLRRAEQLGVILAMEVIDRYESDYINKVDEGLAFIHKIGSENLKLHLDTFHMNIEETDCADSIMKCKDYIGHVHVADSDRWFLGHGHYNFGATFEALKTIGYEGAVSLESYLYPEPITCATRSLNYLKNWL
jgi:sugar phosphate isomerase/epimerase